MECKSPERTFFEKRSQSAFRPKLDMASDPEWMVVEIPFVRKRQGKILQESMIRR